MQLDAVSHEGAMILTVQAERIDAASAVQLKNQFRDATNDATGRVIMDLDQVKFMDSSGLGAMVAVLKLLKGRKLELVNLSPTVSKVFALTRMDKVFKILPDMDEAFASLSSDKAQKAS